MRAVKLNGALLIEEMEPKMHKPLALALMISVSLFAACDKIGITKQSTPLAEDVKKADEKVVKNFDVDHLASDSFKTEVKKMFAPSTTTDLVEAGLKAKGFECRIDPSSKDERGCDKVEIRNGCIYMSVVKTLPFNPDGAQIIKVCDIAQ